MKRLNIISIILSAVLAMSIFSGCSENSSGNESYSSISESTDIETAETSETSADTIQDTVSANTESEVTSSEETFQNNTDITASNTSFSTDISGILDTSSIFTERDLTQTADMTNAQNISLESGKDINITEEGVYIISGTAENTTIRVETADDAKVQLVFDNASIINSTAPAVYVVSADKVFITTTNSDNTLQVTGTFVPDGQTNLDAVIFSKSDLILNGIGTLNIDCTDGNGITSKDDLKVTGGTYNINTAGDGIEANNYIAVSDGVFSIQSQKDAIHSENSDDITLGYIYIAGGEFNITATDDGIQGTTIVQIDGGNINISAVEGIEGTYIQINDGTINVDASDDGINATDKSTAYEVIAEFNGGTVTISMGAGDTDAVDANGNIYVNGGIIDITGQSAFDYDITAELNGGTVTVNGEEITEITGQMMGGGGRQPMMGGGGGRMQKMQ